MRDMHEKYHNLTHAQEKSRGERNCRIDNHSFASNQNSRTIYFNYARNRVSVSGAFMTFSVHFGVEEALLVCVPFRGWRIPALDL